MGKRLATVARYGRLSWSPPTATTADRQADRKKGEPVMEEHLTLWKNIGDIRSAVERVQDAVGELVETEQSVLCDNAEILDNSEFPPERFADQFETPIPENRNRIAEAVLALDILLKEDRFPRPTRDVFGCLGFEDEINQSVGCQAEYYRMLGCVQRHLNELLIAMGTDRTEGAFWWNTLQRWFRLCDVIDNTLSCSEAHPSVETELRKRARKKVLEIAERAATTSTDKTSLEEVARPSAGEAIQSSRDQDASRGRATMPQKDGAQVRKEVTGGTSTAQPPPRKGKKSKNIEKALEIIKEKGPVKGSTVAKGIGVRVTTFRKHYVPILTDRNVLNDGEGYYLAKESDSP